MNLTGKQIALRTGGYFLFLMVYAIIYYHLDRYRFDPCYLGNKSVWGLRMLYFYPILATMVLYGLFFYKKGAYIRRILLTFLIICLHTFLALFPAYLLVVILEFANWPFNPVIGGQPLYDYFYQPDCGYIEWKYPTGLCLFTVLFTGYAISTFLLFSIYKIQSFSGRKRLIGWLLLLSLCAGVLYTVFKPKKSTSITTLMGTVDATQFLEDGFEIRSKCKLYTSEPHPLSEEQQKEVLSVAAERLMELYPEKIHTRSTAERIVKSKLAVEYVFSLYMHVANYETGLSDIYRFSFTDTNSRRYNLYIPIDHTYGTLKLDIRGEEWNQSISF